MKIGVLTFHRAHNYGAVLQAYSLKTYLISLGHTVTFIDYWPDSHEEHYKLFSYSYFKRLNWKRKIKYFLSFLLSAYRKANRRRGFIKFMHVYLNLSKRPKYKNNNFTIDEDIDLIIYGSDQIWRNHITSAQYTGFDPIYFCYNIPRDKIKLITYAVSMGIININREEESFLKQVLNNYSVILVRENSLKHSLSDLGFFAEVVLDPVFLLNMDEWNKILSSSNSIKEKYILYYQLMPSDEGELYAKKLSVDKGIKVIILTGAVLPFPHRNVLQTKNPLEFLQLIRDAEFVVSTSFHGTAFSLIFEKQFYTLGLSKNNDRVLSLLSLVDLECRYINNIHEIISNTNIEKIDYHRVKRLLGENIKRSRLLLKNAL